MEKQNELVEVSGHCRQCGQRMKLRVARWYAEGVLGENPETECPRCFPDMFKEPVVCKWQLVE